MKPKNLHQALILAFLFLLLPACGATPESGAPASPEATHTPPPSLMPTSTPAPTATPVTCQAARQSVALLVEPIYLAPLGEHLNQFAADLCTDGYQAIITPADFTDPHEVRAHLQQLYYQQTAETLAGAILIGDIPYPYLQIRVDFISEDISPRYQEFITLWYYADLDGEFSLSDQYRPVNGEAPLGEPMFDLHPLEVEWEIWVSLLPTYLGDTGGTRAALERFFEKNHAYRMGEIDLPREYIYVTSVEVPTEEEHEEFMYHLLEGTLNWSALKGEGEPQLYFNSPSAGLSELDGYQAITEGRADFSVVIGHGTAGAVEKINPLWLEENPLRTVFFWTQSCSVGDLDNPYNIMSQILYHPDSLVLFVSGNTTEAGGLGKNLAGPHPSNIATALSEGATLGEAIMGHVNTPLISHHARNPELTVAPKIFFGDLTLTLRQ